MAAETIKKIPRFEFVSPEEFKSVESGKVYTLNQVAWMYEALKIFFELDSSV